MNVELLRGDYLGIVGPNGAGKSTLLLGMLGVLSVQEGVIHRQPDLRVGYVPQRTALDDIFPLTARDIVRMGHELAASCSHAPEDIERVLNRVGLEKLGDRRFAELSGGQKQRVLLARALVVDPELLILDEPTNGLDFPSEIAIMALVDELHRQGRSIVLVTHQLNLVANHAAHLALVGDGRVVAGSRDDLLSGDRLMNVYGTGLKVLEMEGKKIVVPRADS